MARDRSGSGYPAGRGDGVVVPADVRDVLDIRRVPDLHLRLLGICNTRKQCKVRILQHHSVQFPLHFVLNWFGGTT